MWSEHQMKSGEQHQYKIQFSNQLPLESKQTLYSFCIHVCQCQIQPENKGHTVHVPRTSKWDQTDLRSDAVAVRWCFSQNMCCCGCLRFLMCWDGKVKGFSFQQMAAQGFVADSFEMLCQPMCLGNAGQGGWVSTNTSYMPEVILLHKVQHLQDSPHPCH